MVLHRLYPPSIRTPPTATAVSIGKEYPSQSTVPVELLSNRELAIFRLIGQGKTTIQIAKLLHLTVSTAETYRHRLREKLGLKNGTEVTHRAIC